MNRIIVVDVDGVVLPGMPKQWADAARAVVSVDETKYNFGVTTPAGKARLYEVLHANVDTFYGFPAAPRFDWMLIAELQDAQARFDTRVNFVTYAPSAAGFAAEARAKLEMLQCVLPASLHWSYSASHDSAKLHYNGDLMIEDNQTSLEGWCEHHQRPGVLMAQPWNKESTLDRITRVSDAHGLRLAFEAAFGCEGRE